MSGYSIESLSGDLVRLGVEKGDMLFVHSSFKSVGKVENGAGTVIEALEDAVGPDGLILMPSFNLKPKTLEERIAIWDIDETPSSAGWLTEYFRQLPGTVRSNQFCHSVAAIGKGAGEIVVNESPEAGYDSPWDAPEFPKDFGTYSIMPKAYRAGGKILMLGVDYNSSTFIHYVEVIYWNQRREDMQNARYAWLKRDLLGDYWDQQGKMARTNVGDADCRLFSISEFVDELLVEVKRNPANYSK